MKCREYVVINMYEKIVVSYCVVKDEMNIIREVINLEVDKYYKL